MFATKLQKEVFSKHLHLTFYKQQHVYNQKFIVLCECIKTTITK